LLKFAVNKEKTRDDNKETRFTIEKRQLIIFINHLKRESIYGKKTNNDFGVSIPVFRNGIRPDAS
jgi:hypothetical protein